MITDPTLFWAYCLKHSWTPESPCSLCKEASVNDDGNSDIS